MKIMNQMIQLKTCLFFLLLQYPCYIQSRYQEHYLDGYEIRPGVVSVPLRPRYYISKKENNNILKENIRGGLDEEEDDVVIRRLEEEEEDEEERNKKRTYLGTQFADLYIGGPAILRPLAVSTKSEFTAFPCTGCSDCGTSTKLFDSTASPSFKRTACGDCSVIPVRPSDTTTTNCDDLQKYCYIKEDFIQKGLWEGSESSDYVYIGGARIDYSPIGTDVPRKFGFSLRFACQTSVKGWFVTNYRDGILAMSDSPTSFINQMYDNNKLAQRMFSLCFGFANGGNSSPGALTLGGSDPKYHDTPTVWMQNTHAREESYTLYLKKIWLRGDGGMSVHPPRDGMKVYPVSFDVAKVNSPSGVILDSSMPYTSFSNELDAGFRAAWQKATGQVYTYGRIRLLEGDLEKGDTEVDRNIDPNTVPGLVGDLDPTSPFDVLFAVPAQSYMEYNHASGFYRTRLTFTNPTDNVFGANAMQGHDICFDLGTMRIGVAESRQCKAREQSASGVADDDLFASPVDIISQNGFIMPFNKGNGDGPGNNKGLGVVTTSGAVDNSGVNRKFKNNPMDMNSISGFEPDANILATGACTTMLCRAFLGIGYTVALVTIFVLYSCSRMKKGSRHHLAAHEDAFYGDDQGDDQGDGYGEEEMTYFTQPKQNDFESMVDTYNQGIYDDRQVVDDINDDMYRDEEQEQSDDYNRQLHGDEIGDMEEYNQSLYGDQQQSPSLRLRQKGQESEHVFDEYAKTFHGDDNIPPQDVEDYNRDMYGDAHQEVEDYNREMYGDEPHQEADDYNREMQGGGDAHQDVDDYNRDMYGDAHQEVEDYNREMYGDEPHQEADDYNREMQGGGDAHQDVDDCNRKMYGYEGSNTSSSDREPPRVSGLTDDKMHMR